MWELVGIGTIAEGSRLRRLLAGGGVEFVQASVEAIDPDAVACGPIVVVEADFLVVALGAEPRPDLVAGMAEHTYDVWEAARVPTAPRAALEAFEGGRICVVIAGRRQAPAGTVRVHAAAGRMAARARDARAHGTGGFDLPTDPAANAGRAGSAWLEEQLAARGIEAQAGRGVERFEAGLVVYEDGELEADLVIGVPHHRPRPRSPRAPWPTTRLGVGRSGHARDRPSRRVRHRRRDPDQTRQAGCRCRRPVSSPSSRAPASPPRSRLSSAARARPRRSTVAGTASSRWAAPAPP